VKFISVLLLYNFVFIHITTAITICGQRRLTLYTSLEADKWRY